MSRPVPPYMPALTGTAIVGLATLVGAATGAVGAMVAVVAAAGVSALAAYTYGRRAGHRDMAAHIRHAGRDLTSLQEDVARLETGQEFARIAAVEDSDGLTRDWRWRS